MAERIEAEIGGTGEEAAARPLAANAAPLAANAAPLAANAAPLAANAAIVLAAGRSRRMRSDAPKVLHTVLGLPLVEHVVRAARAAGCAKIVVVASPDGRDAIANALGAEGGPADVAVVVQQEQRGTADAVLAARAALADVRGTALVLLGDAPCVTPASLRALVAEHAARAASLSVLSGVVAQPHGYGRIVRGPDRDLARIVEERDAGPDVRALAEINSGVMALELPAMFDTIAKVTPSGATGELYLTSAIEVARGEGKRVIAVPAAAQDDVLGVNDRAQLAQATAVLRRRINADHMARGVTIVDPESAFIDARAEIEPDARIEPFVVVEGPCRIERGAQVGPFARVRGGSTLRAGCRVGNFVEVVRTEVGANTRALHLTYLGDGTLGPDVNVGAGVVFANFDGARHHATHIGAGASVGAGTVVVAPARLGEGCRTGAGAVVVRGEVPPGATFVGVPAGPIHARPSPRAQDH